MVIPVYQNNWSFSSKCVAIELWFTMVLWKKNYGMLLWNKYGTTTKTYEILIYYGKNYGTIKNHGNIINQILL